MSTSKGGRKDKGKAKVVQKPDDYQIQIPVQIPTQNQFHPLSSQFPPLTYKAAAAQSSIKRTTDNSYVSRHTEHLFLTSYLTIPSSLSLRPIILKMFGNKHFATDHLAHSQKFYELILVDTKSIDLTHTFDKFHPDQILYSKCIIKNVLGSKQWPDPWTERKFSIQFSPQTYNYNDYRNAWFRTFLYYPETHSWFFNFHDNCCQEFPIWFYYWWTWFGFSHGILPAPAKEGWELWFKHQTSIAEYQRELLFFRFFNIAWIFSWEYRLQQFLQKPFPLSLVRLYKVKWWNEFKMILCSKENVEHFCRTRTKKFTLHNLHLLEGPQPDVGPSTPVKKERSSSRDSKFKGLSQKEKDLLEYLKDDPSMRQMVLQKILAKQDDGSDGETVSSAASSAPPKPFKPKAWADYEDSQDPYDM